MMKKTIFVLFVLLCCISVTSALAAPKAETIKTVVDFFYEGQKEGPVLVDAKLCKSVKALECESPLEAGAIKLGEAVKVWMQFFVPKGGEFDDIFVEYKLNAMPRHLQAHKVEGSIRYRIVDTYTPDKAGEWTVTVKRGTTNLKMFNFKVNEK